MTFEDLKKGIASEWLKIFMLLVALIGSWYKFDDRISRVEAREEERAQQVQQLTEVIQKLNGTLDRMNQTMEEFPPHLHVHDDDVVYPGETGGRGRKRK